MTLQNLNPAGKKCSNDLFQPENKKAGPQVAKTNIQNDILKLIDMLRYRKTEDFRREGLDRAVKFNLEFLSSFLHLFILKIAKMPLAPHCPR